MTKATLIGDKRRGLRSKFVVEIDLTGFNDDGLRRMARDLRDVDWDFANDIADIILRQE